MVYVALEVDVLKHHSPDRNPVPVFRPCRTSSRTAVRSWSGQGRMSADRLHGLWKSRFILGLSLGTRIWRNGYRDFSDVRPLVIGRSGMHRAPIVVSIAKWEPDDDPAASVTLSNIKSTLNDVIAANPFRMRACRFFRITSLECAPKFYSGGGLDRLRRS